MSFATALGDYIGGRNRARAAHAQTQFENQREIASDKQTAALNAANLRASGYDPSGQPLPPLPIPPALQQIVPGNEGQGGQPKPEQYVQHYLGLAAEATRQGRPDLAKQYADQATAWGLSAERTALAGLNQVRGQEITQGKIPEEQARATYYRDRLGVDLQKAKMVLQAAQGHDAARVQAAQTAASASIQRAGITGQAAIDARILAGYYALQGRSMQDATAMAVQNARGAEQYAAAEGKATGEFPAFQPAQAPEIVPFSVPQLPPLTINVGGQPTPVVPQNTPIVPLPVRSGANQHAGGGAPHPAADAVKKTADIIRQQRTAGKSDAEITAQAHAAGVPDAQIQAALKLAGPARTGAGAPMAPIPLGGWTLH